MPFILSKALRSRKSSSRSSSNTSQPLEGLSVPKTRTTGSGIANIDGASSSHHGSQSGTQPSAHTADQRGDTQLLPSPTERRRGASWKKLLPKKRSELNLSDLSSDGYGTPKVDTNKDTKYAAIRSHGRRFSLRRRSSTVETETRENHASVVGSSPPVLPPIALSSSPLMGELWPTEAGDAVPSGSLRPAKEAPTKVSADQGRVPSIGTSEMTLTSDSSDDSFKSASESWADEVLMALKVSSEKTQVTSIEACTSEDEAVPLAGKEPAGHKSTLVAIHEHIEVAPGKPVSGLSGPGTTYNDAGFEPTEELRSASRRTSGSRTSSFGSKALKHTLSKLGLAITSRISSASTQRRRSSSQSYEADAEDNACAKPTRGPTPLKGILLKENTKRQLSPQDAPATSGPEANKSTPFKGNTNPLPWEIDNEVWTLRTNCDLPNLEEVEGILTRELGLSGIPPAVSKDSSSDEKTMRAPSRAVRRRTIRWSDEEEISPPRAAPSPMLAPSLPALSDEERSWLRALDHYTEASYPSNSSVIQSTPRIVPSDVGPYEAEACRPFVAARLPFFGPYLG